MAVHAGVRFVIARFVVAGRAAGLMVTIQPEVTAMVEGCRFPARCLVTARASGGYLAMQGIRRYILFMADSALAPRCGNPGMVEHRITPPVGSVT